MEEITKEENQQQEKCFVIMPISDQGDYPAGHFTKVYDQIIKPAVREAGYEPYRVDENNICDNIINKIFDAIQECPMAICDLSNRNPNVLYELGLRQAYDKPVVLIQDEKTEKIFDVSGISTVFYKSARLYEDVIEARDNIKKAILSTKDGKMNTLVRIVKARTPDLSNIEVSQDDRTKVILDGIYNEIRQINKKNSSDNEFFKIYTMHDTQKVMDQYLQNLYEIDFSMEVDKSKDNLGMLLKAIIQIERDLIEEDKITDKDRTNLIRRAMVTEKTLRDMINHEGTFTGKITRS